MEQPRIVSKDGKTSYLIGDSEVSESEYTKARKETQARYPVYRPGQSESDYNKEQKNIVVAIAVISIILLLIFAGLFAWISIQSGISTFATAAKSTDSADATWTQFAGVITGIVFMSAAVFCGILVVGISIMLSKSPEDIAELKRMAEWGYTVKPKEKKTKKPEDKTN